MNPQENPIIQSVSQQLNQNPVIQAGLQALQPFVQPLQAATPSATTTTDAPVSPEQVQSQQIAQAPVTPETPQVAATTAQPTQTTQTPAPLNTGTSIIDYLKSTGEPSDFTSRAQLAAQQGISGYRGTAAQNIELLNKVRSKPSGISTPQTEVKAQSEVSPNAGSITPITPTPQTSSVISQYGFTPEVISAQTNKSPFNAFVDSYQALYKDLGLPSVKSEYEKLTKDYKDIEDRKFEEIADVNEDPWLSESVRQEKIRRIEDRYESKTSSLTNQIKNMESLYSRGQEEVKFVAGQAMQASHNQQVLEQAWAIKAMELAQKQAEAEQKTGEDFTLSPGSTRFDAQGNVVASVPKSAGASDLPSDYQSFLLSQQDPAFAQFLKQKNSSDLSVDESKSRQFAVSAQTANDALARVNYDPGFVEASFVPNVLKGEQRQQFEQAARAFTNAVLRRESGATITDAEFLNKYKELIPQAGDKKGNLEQKSVARQNAVNSLIEAGQLSPAQGGGIENLKAMYGVTY